MDNDVMPCLDVLEYRKALALPSGPVRAAVEWDAMLDDALVEVEQLRAENARLRREIEALARHHRETAKEEADRQEAEDLGPALNHKLSGKITVRLNVSASLERILSAPAKEE